MSVTTQFLLYRCWKQVANNAVMFAIINGHVLKDITEYIIQFSPLTNTSKHLEWQGHRHASA